MRKFYIIFAMALLLPLTTLAQGWPANYGGVMLQGFFWDSYKETPDCSPFGPWQYHQNNEATATHKPGYTWATMYGAGWATGEEWQVPVTTWSSLLAHKSEITPYIDLLWLPQSGSTVADSTMTYYTSNDNSGRNGVRPWRNGQTWGYSDNSTITNPDCMGFVPVFYFHHGLSYNPDGTPWTYTDSQGKVWTPMSYFGTEAELRELISTFKAEGTGAIEDVVANHRGGLGTWSGDKNSIEFPTEYYKGTFSPDGEYISWSSDDVCSDDESGRGTGNADCGGRGEWARDIDHHSPVTRLKVMKFLDFLKNDLGYVGYRYDYAMGFEEKHFAEYNTTLRPTFSVGEYWGSKNDISNWIHKTYMEGTYQSAAFDFPLQSDIREAFNYGHYRYLNNSGLISDPVLKRYAVTFLDNHDTFKDLPTDGSNYNWESGKPYNHRVEKNIVEANAFILAMPGTPCLFYPHFMHPQWHDILVTLIKARRTAGITNESERSAAELVGNDGIQWIVTGTNGQVCFQLGDAASSDTLPPEGFKTVWESNLDENGKRVARYSITSSLYHMIQYNSKQNLINGYPVIDRNSCTFTGSIDVNVAPSSPDCKLVYTTNGSDPNPNSPAITESTTLTFDETTTLKVGVSIGTFNVPTSSIVTRKYVKTDSESDRINFYVKDDNAPNFYVYYDDENGTQKPLGEWGGTHATEQVKVGGINWWHVSIAKPSVPVNLIINWDGSQTPDITGITSDVFYTVQNGLPNDVTSIYMPILENPQLDIDKITGSYEGSVTATITSSNSNVTIVYTTDGTEPTASSPTIASGNTVTFNTTGNHYLRAGILKDGEVIKQVARSYYVENGHGSGVNIYVKNMTTGDAPHIYAWNASEEAVTTAFEQGGETLTETATNCGQTWYKRHFDEVPAGLMFLITGAKDQCANISGLQDGHDYYFYYYPGAHFGNQGYQPGYIDVTADAKHTTDVKAITVFMYDNGNADWANGLKLYPYTSTGDIFWNWAGSWAEAGFPTTTMGDQSWYYCTFLGKESINAILFNSNNDSERFEVQGVTSDVFIKFPAASDNWSTGTNETETYAQYLPAVETPEEGTVTPVEEDPIPSCATAVGEGLYFYFENDSYGSPTAWVYSSTNTFCNHGWPGDALVEVVGTSASGNLVYRWTRGSSYATPAKVIFSNNGQNQTADFDFVNGGYYTTAGLKGMAHDNIMTLDQLIRFGQWNKEYIISDDITGVVTIATTPMRDGDKSMHLFAKGKDGESQSLSINTEGKPVPEPMEGWTFDQSNWLELVLPTESTLELDNHTLLGHTVVGKITEFGNTVMELSANPLPGKQVDFTPNNYLVLNFDNLNSDYFYVRPKAQEYSTIKYAIYHDGKFIMANQTGDDPWDIALQGSVQLAYPLDGDQPYYQGETPLDELIVENGVYELKVITKDSGRNIFVAIVDATKVGDFQEMPATTLADVLENGVDGELYRIADDLAVVDLPQNFDYQYAFLTDGNNNWIRVEYPGDLWEQFQKDNFIAGGSLKGVLHDKDLNPYLVVTTADFGAPLENDVVIENVNMAEPFAFKPNQVIDVTGYWNASDGALRAYAPNNAIQGQSLTLSTEWALWGGQVTLIDGTCYKVRAAITLKEPWNSSSTGGGIGPKDYDYPFQNYVANALYEPESNIATGVESVRTTVKSVRYINAAGLESDTPFQGVNIVVTEMADGTKKVTKMLK